jgi:hypothetical protein
LHATSAQFLRAYPQADQFFSLKREYDPQELFQNQFYRKYGKQSVDVDEIRPFHWELPTPLLV